MSAASREPRELLLGEWACLGILMQEPAHGFAVAARLKPEGDVGRVWSLSRALTYRSLDTLRAHDLVRDLDTERGLAGGNRTILGPTQRGTTRFRAWVQRPVPHLRDLRSELLLKLVLAEQCGIEVDDLLERQHAHVTRLRQHARARMEQDSADVVDLWRLEAAEAAARFLTRVATRQSSS